MANQQPAEGRRTKAAFLALRDAWIDYANQCSELTAAQFRVGVFIALRMNAKDQSSWWSVEAIARSLEMSTRTVSDAIAALDKAGLLVVCRPRRREGYTYFLRLPYGVPET